MNTDIFIAGRGFFYKIDPRTKIILTVCLCIFVFLPVKLYILAIVSLALPATALYTVGFKNTGRIFLSIFPMLFLMLLFSPLYDREGQPLFTIGSTVLLTKEGLYQSLLLDIRFFSITFICSLLFLTTKTEEFILALQDFSLPYTACLTISLVFTAIPGIINSFYQIDDSHKLRRSAIQNGKKNLHNRLRNLFPTLTSAIVVSLRNIPTLAMSLESRGFGLHCKRTSYHDLKSYRHPVRDTIALLILFVVLFIVSKK